MLSLVQRLFYGPESTLVSSKPADDLRIGQLAVLAPLVFLMLVMGLAPSLWLNAIQSGVHPPPALRQLVQRPMAKRGLVVLILSGGSQHPVQAPTHAEAQR
jgi:NADH:ubiquinone oxidoreductase subunit 4 (subunit M)